MYVTMYVCMYVTIQVIELITQLKLNLLKVFRSIMCRASTNKSIPKCRVCRVNPVEADTLCRVRVCSELEHLQSETICKLEHVQS